MSALGSSNSNGVPLSVEFVFDGTAVNWGGANLYSLAPLSNSSESVDGSYEISDLDVELIDTNGSIWAALGNGTRAFYRTLSATAYVGGNMQLAHYGPTTGSRMAKSSNVGAGTFVLHTGQVVEVSKYNRLVRIKSQNNLKALEDMEWIFPYTEISYPANASFGSYLFYSGNFATTFKDSITDWDEERSRFTVWAAVGTSDQGFWPINYPIQNRDTTGPTAGVGRLQGYSYPGTNFFTDFQIVKLTGTYMGSYCGTLETTEGAQRYGFRDNNAAETIRSGTHYTVNKTRFSMQDGTPLVGSHLMFQQNLTLQDTPANIFKYLLTSHAVTAYFGTSDIEPNSFGTTQNITIFQNFSQRIAPEGGKVAPSLKNLISSVYGQFAVDQNNKFVFMAYGPRNLTASLGTVGSTTLVDSTFSSAKQDAKNRFVVRYAHDPDSDNFQKSVEMKLGGWSGTVDNPLTIESKWIKDDNEASILALRLLKRFVNTVPHVDLTTSMQHTGVWLGTLLNVIDPDSGLLNKVVEVVGFEKDLTDQRQIKFRCIDGETVYSRKGYGQWMSGTIQPSGNVSGTSTLGWGTSGTMAGINPSIYGSMFVWW